MANYLDALLRYLVDSPEQMGLTDVRSPSQRTADALRGRVAQDAANQLATATANPQWGMLSPTDQAIVEQDLSKSIRNRTGAQGAGGTGSEADQIRKGLVDFRIQQLANRQKNLNDLRQQVFALTQPVGPAQTATPYERGPINFAVRRGVTDMATRGFANASNALFGTPTAAEEAARQPGGAPGTTGYRIPDWQPPALKIGQSGLGSPSV